MDTVWLCLGEEEDRKIAESLNSDGKYVECNLSWYDYDKEFGHDISYSTFCNLKLQKAFDSISNSEKELILMNFGWAKILDFKLELSYILSLILPLDPIFVSSGNAIQTIENLHLGTKFRRSVEFDPSRNFIVDLKRGLEEQARLGSDISKIVSMFNAYGTYLSFSQDPKEVIRLKAGAFGQRISYEEFIQTVLSDKSKIQDLSSTAFVREHNPVDLFIQKASKSKKNHSRR